MSKSNTFEEKLKEAKEILEKLMDSEVPLEESIKLYQNGLKQINEAQKMLEEAKLKVETISKEISGVNK